MSTLHFEEAETAAHFSVMSFIHALGWRTTYAGAVPAEFMEQVVTDDRWIPSFEENYRLQLCQGILLYDGDIPVACANYGAARIGKSSRSGTICSFHSEGYEGWGEVISFYTHAAYKGKGYGGMLMEEVLRRLKKDGFSRCYVLVLRENMGARRFYERHGFAWDGTQEEIPFPPDTVCVDLRYVRSLEQLGAV